MFPSIVEIMTESEQFLIRENIVLIYRFDSRFDNFAFVLCIKLWIHIHVSSIFRFEMSDP